MTRRRTIKDYDWIKNKRYLNPITGWTEAKVVKLPSRGINVLRDDRKHLGVSAVSAQG